MSRTEFLDGRVVLLGGDCRDALRGMADNSVDSVVTDPPYHLTSMVNRLSKTDTKDVEKNFTKTIAGQGGNPFASAARGFMGKQWDGGDIAFDTALWADVLRVLKPGGYAVMFGGTRTVHRMVCAIEDAGFEIRDEIVLDKDSETEYRAFEGSLNDEQHSQFRKLFRERGAGRLSWQFGTGFPKSHDVSKAIDKMAGVKFDASPASGVGFMGPDKPGGYNRTVNQLSRSGESTAIARQWEGWGTALKPAHEPICLARKPLSELSISANVLRWGTGALNIGASKIHAGDAQGGAYTVKRLKPGATLNKTGGNWRPDDGVEYHGETTPGRWPANLVHDNSPQVLACFPDSEVSGSAKRGTTVESTTGMFGKRTSNIASPNDSGSAARFFASFPQDDEPSAHCGICYSLYMQKSDSNIECNANNAKPNLQTKNTPIDASAHYDVADSRAPENEANESLSNIHVIGAEHGLLPARLLSGDIAQRDAPTQLLLKTVQNVKSAARLCNLCATNIARVLVELRTRQSVASLPFQDFISGRNAPILIHHLAHYAEGREGTDIILTTESLKTLLGSVFLAIESTIGPSEEPRLPGAPEKSKRIWYGPKADSDTRLGSLHPTVKPLSLMQYLVRLITPPGGTVLDIFAGTGTTAEAAYREGFKSIICEREVEYQADIARRMSLVMDGKTTRKHAGIKARGKESDAGPLFGGGVQ